MLYKVVLTFESVDEILKCDHSNESYSAIPSYGTVYYVVQSGSNFLVCRCNPILGDPGADSGGKGKSEQAEKYGMKKSKEQREKPLGTTSYQTSYKRSLPF